MRLFKTILKTILILFGLFVVFLMILLQAESYEKIDQVNEKGHIKVEVKKVFGIKICETELNSKGYYHGKSSSWSLFKKNQTAIGNYKDGFWHGEFKTFDDDGNLEMVRIYEKGVLVK